MPTGSKTGHLSCQLAAGLWEQFVTRDFPSALELPSQGHLQLPGWREGSWASLGTGNTGFFKHRIPQVRLTHQLQKTSGPCLSILLIELPVVTSTF